MDFLLRSLKPLMVIWILPKQETENKASETKIESNKTLTTISRKFNIVRKLLLFPIWCDSPSMCPMACNAAENKKLFKYFIALVSAPFEVSIVRFGHRIWYQVFLSLSSRLRLLWMLSRLIKCSFVALAIDGALRRAEQARRKLR